MKEQIQNYNERLMELIEHLKKIKPICIQSEIIIRQRRTF